MLDQIMEAEALGRSRVLTRLAFCAIAATLVAVESQAQTIFTDSTSEAGFLENKAGWSHAWADYDKDGDVDVITFPHFVSFSEGEAPRLWRNNGDGTFSDVTASAGIVSGDDTHGVAWGDYDNDGDVDIYIAKGGLKQNPIEFNELWRNNNNGTFTNIADSAGVNGDENRARGAYAVDYDRDRDLDIFVMNFVRSDGVGANQLYDNNGNLVFTDVATEAGLALAGTGEGVENRIAAWSDYDGDADLDVLVAIPCALFQNNGDGTFADVTVPAGVTTSTECYNAAWGDYDNDSDTDVYINMRGGNQGILYRNNDDGTFTDVTEASGAVNIPHGNQLDRAIGITWGDYDNDGHLDLYVVNTNNLVDPNRLFRNNGDGTFSDVTAEAQVGAQVPGQGADANFVDHDNDGFLDLFVSNGGGNSVGSHVLYTNNGNGNGWLKVTLKGRQSQSNRGAIGAKLALTAQGVTQYRELTGQHYMAQDAIPVHFGLGSATVIDTLTITWPSGVVQTVRNIAAKRSITVGERRSSP